MSWLLDLYKRLFANYQSSLTALAVVIITFLTDHGINISADNAKTVTAKFVLWGVALLKLFGLDDPTPPDTPPVSRGGDR